MMKSNSTPFLPFALSAALGVFASMAVFSSSARAQTDDAAAQRTAIEQFYPIMIEALGKGDFNGARLLCHQAIKWEPENPAHYYNLACIEARAGQINMGLAALTKAADYGYADADGTAGDSDLDPLRSSPIYKAQYEKILANHRAATGGVPQTPSAPAPGLAQRPLTPPAPLPAETQPVKHKVTAKGPVGLYISSHYSIVARSLRHSSWYFTPDGMAYENPAHGFSAAELAQSETIAKISAGGGELTITWSDGKTSSGRYDPKPEQNAFVWDRGDMGNYVAAQGFKNPAVIVGSWEGGFSNSFSGTSGSVARTLTLNADGSYESSSTTSISADSDGSIAKAGASGGNTGTWKVGQYSLTLTGSDGSVSRSIAFPFVVDGSEGPLDRFYYNGILWKRTK